MQEDNHSMANVFTSHARARLIPAGLALVVAVAVILLGSTRISAPTAHADVTGVPHMYLDVTAPFCTTPGDTHPSATGVLAGTTYQVGICMQDTTAAPDGFQVTLDYNELVTGGPEVANVAPALADNPDANDGGLSSQIGTGWDCTGFGFAYPQVNDGSGNSYIACLSDAVTPVTTLTDDPGLVATITYTADAVGFNTMTFVTGGASTGGTNSGIGNCDGTNCFGATVQHLAAADIQVTKSAPAAAVAGDAVHYIVTVTNAGPSQAADVTAFDDLPDVASDGFGWTATAATIDGGPDILGGQCVVGNPTATFLNVVICGLGPMNSGDSHVIDITVQTGDEIAGKLWLNSAFAGSGAFPTITTGTLDPDLYPMEVAACLLDPTPPTAVGNASPCPNNPTAIPDADSTDDVSAVSLCASDRYDGTAFDPGPGDPLHDDFVDVNPADECDNVALAATFFLPANMSLSKTGPASAGVGDTINYTITATNGAGGSPAPGVQVVDTIDANQSIVSASGTGWTCVVTGTPGVTAANTATCDLTGSVAPGTSAAAITVAAVILSSPANVTCTNTAAGTWSDPVAFGPATANVTCLPPNVTMYKDKHPESATRENVVNLWLCGTPAYDGTFGVGGAPTAGTAPCNENGEGRLILGEMLTNINDPEGLGAFEFQVKFDHKIFDVNVTATDFLYSTGRVADLGSGVGGCTNSIINENAILFGCVSKNPVDGGGNPIITPGPTGNGMVAVIEVLPEADLRYRITPGQENGIARKILDENCEAADIYGDPLADGLGNPLPGIVTGGLVEDCGDVDVTVRILEGDLNLDCTVDVLDDQAIAFRYGAYIGSLRYDPWFDLEPALRDYDVDIKDLQKVFGRNGSDCSQSGLPADGTIPAQPPVIANVNIGL